MTAAVERTDDEIEEMAENVLEMVGLEDRMDHMPHEMSGGQQQRVAIARALMHEPVLLLADEPTGNLDSASADSVLEALENLHRHGTTLLMVTHEPEIAEFAERTIKFFDGNIVQDKQNGSPKNGKKK